MQVAEGVAGRVGSGKSADGYRPMNVEPLVRSGERQKSVTASSERDATVLVQRQYLMP